MMFYRLNHFLSAGILSPGDEFQYWADLSESAEKHGVRERARHFVEIFRPIEKVCRFGAFNSLLNCVVHACCVACT